MKKNKFFLWPSRLKSFPKNWSSIYNIHSSHIDKILGRIYSPYEVVIFPSGRSALYHILKARGLKRNDEVTYPGFTSRCVIDAISYIASPTLNLDHSKAIIIYHQWGFVKKIDPTVASGRLIIEDSCDSLVRKPEALFPNGGEFEIFSCSKLFGILAGGFVICRHAEDAEILRRIRDDSKWSVAVLQYLLKVFNNYFQNDKFTSIYYEYYNGVEAVNGKCLDIISALMKENILKLDEITKKRLDILDYIMQRNKDFYDFDNLNRDRLPSNLPYRFKDYKIIERLKDLGFVTGIRNFNSGTYDKPAWKECIPLPINQFIDIDKLSRALHLLR